MTVPYPDNSTERSCCDCLRSSVSWEEPLGGAGCLGGAALIVYGAVISNPVVAAISGVTAIASAVLGGRATYLRRNSDLNNAVTGLNRTVAQLTADNTQKMEEVRQLESNAKILRENLIEMEIQKEKIKNEREAALERISNLTTGLGELEKKYRAVQSECQKIQQSLVQAQKEKDKAYEKAAQEIRADEAQLAERIPLLTQNVTELQTATRQAKAENERLQTELGSFKEQNNVLDQKIKEIREEKEALQKLVSAEQTQAELQQSIQEQTAQLAAIESRLAELAPQLQKIIKIQDAAVGAGMQ